MARALTRRFTGGRRMQAQWSNVIVESRVVGSSGATLGAMTIGGTATDRLTLARVRGSA